MGSRARVPLVVGGLVLLPALAFALLPGGGPAPADDGDPAVPAQMAAYSYLTGDVSSAPPGRAVALFQHGWGVEFMDLPQAVVVGANGDVYRRLDLAEGRTGPENQGDPGPMLLSPDGTSVAVGEHDSGRPDLAVLDLRTGAVTRYPVPGGRSVLPVAWSPDGRLVAHLVSESATSTTSGMPPEGTVGVLDLTSGETREVEGATGVWAAAFSPDGRELAVQRSDAAGGTLEVVALDGSDRRDVPLPAGHHLGGADAWSPDGALLATARAPFPCLDLVEESEWLTCQEEWEAVPDVIDFVAATAASQPVPAPVQAAAVAEDRVLGWASDREVLVLAGRADEGGEGGDPDGLWLTEVSLDDGATEPMSAVPATANYGVGRFQLAAGLAPDLVVREAGEPDRGPWPTGLRVTAAVLAAAGAGLLALVVTRRTRRP